MIIHVKKSLGPVNKGNKVHDDIDEAEEVGKLRQSRFRECSKLSVKEDDDKNEEKVEDDALLMESSPNQRRLALLLYQRSMETQGICLCRAARTCLRRWQK